MEQRENFLFINTTWLSDVEQTGIQVRTCSQNGTKGYASVFRKEKRPSII